jgi:hypothetical protein
MTNFERTGGQTACAAVRTPYKQDVQILWMRKRPWHLLRTRQLIDWGTSERVETYITARKSADSTFIGTYSSPCPRNYHTHLMMNTIHTVWTELLLGNERTYTENSDLMRYVNIYVSTDLWLTQLLIAWLDAIPSFQSSIADVLDLRTNRLLFR